MLRTSSLAAAVALSALAGAAHASAAGGLLYERTLMGEAGGRCGLFAPPVAAALDAARRQARGAALRAGSAEADVAAMETRARSKAWTVDCRSADLAIAAGRVRAGFAGYARLPRMSFPGLLASWAADRTPGPRWRLAQASGPMTFGVAADERGAESVSALWTGAGLGQAYGARLVMRDPGLARSPYLDQNRRGWAGRAPPATITRAVWASDRSPGPATLSRDGKAGGVLFRFPAAAMEALQALDPREAVTVEVVFPARDGERTRSALVEVGDFAAARAFLAAR